MSNLDQFNRWLAATMPFDDMADGAMTDDEAQEVDQHVPHDVDGELQQGSWHPIKLTEGEDAQSYASRDAEAAGA